MLRKVLNKKEPNPKLMGEVSPKSPCLEKIMSQREDKRKCHPATIPIPHQEICGVNFKDLGHIVEVERERLMPTEDPKEV